jgi:N-acetylglucosamine kinase-like BadF-type ATPase
VGAAGPSNHLLVVGDVVARSLDEAIGEALLSGGLRREDVACLSAGLAGVDYNGVGAHEMEALLRSFGFDHLTINGDMVIAHAGALGARAGVVALAGTGSAILGVGAAGERVKVGGWGPVYGDEGSAYRIGQMALRAAARAFDGRGPATALTEAIMRDLCLRDFRETIASVYVRGMEPREIAALSRVAYEVAAAGDDVASAIFYQAGEELAESVEAAIRGLEMADDEVPVSYQGAVLESCLLVRQRFADALKARVPGAEVVPPQFEPVVGAYLLGRRALSWLIEPAVLTELESREANG